jgi:Bacterial transglutaminase-like N-terminal region
MPPVYPDSEPVELGEHRMMFRPRASQHLRLIKTSLAITPRPADTGSNLWQEPIRSPIRAPNARISRAAGAAPPD